MTDVERCWSKVRPTLSPIIFGTKWDRDKLFWGFELSKQMGPNGI